MSKQETTTTGKENKAPNSRLTAFAAIAGVFVMLFFIYAVPMKRYAQSRAELRTLQQRFADLKADKGTELARLQNQEQLTAKLKERKPGFELWSFLNTTLTETNLKERASLDNFRLPATHRKEPLDGVAMVQLRLTGVTMKEVVDLFYKIAQSNNVIVVYKMEHLRSTPDNKGLECSVVLLTPKASV